MPKTSGNVLTLRLTGPLSSLSTTNNTYSSCLPKQSTTPALCLQSPTTPNAFGKLFHCYLSLLLALHLQTGLLLFSQAKYPNPIFLSPATLAATTSPHSSSPPATPPDFSVFTPALESEIHNILFNCPNKQSDSDPIPTWHLKECASVLAPTKTNAVNLLLTSGHFHPTFKESVISLLLTKPTLDIDYCNSPTIGQSRIFLSYPK